MMMINFRDLKHGYTLNCSFFLMDGGEVSDLSTFQMGDIVHLLFDVTKTQHDAINDNLSPEVGLHAYRDGMLNPPRYTVHIPCTLVERCRAVSYRKGDIGSLHDLGYSVTLEANNGYWQDVFEWVAMGKNPSWVDQPEETKE